MAEAREGDDAAVLVADAELALSLERRTCHLIHGCGRHQIETQGLLGAGTEARLRVARACKSARRGGCGTPNIRTPRPPGRTFPRVG
jgi:hypothetical protein